MRNVVPRLGVLLGLMLGPVFAAPPPADPLRPPDRAWLENALDVPDAEGWKGLAAVAMDAALQAEAANRTDALEAWLVLSRWAHLLGTDQRRLTDRWIAAINAAGLGHANMPRTYDEPAEPLSRALSKNFALTLLGDAELSRGLFDLLTPYDRLPRVLGILDELHGADPSLFRQYRQLALAIALVFDVPPPPHWPHAQVSARALPRRTESPLAAFAFWTESDRRRATLHRLDRLQAFELKFIVDAAAPGAERRWAQSRVDLDLANLPRAYDAVPYLSDRAEQRQYEWPGATYRLPEVLATGGICIDQAYFATEVGKARGVPTLLFRGVGSNGRHAWFGFLDANQRWQFDVGRYAEQRLVAGEALNPQTWGDVNDHELAFLAERFRLLPAYRQSRAREWLAQEHLRRGDAAAAVAAAQRAVNHETRNVGAWEMLVIAQRAAGVEAVKRESTLRQAARALQKYPDLNARFLREVVAVLRERGQTSAAAHEERQLALKFSSDRSDLAVAQAAEMLNRSLEGDDAGTQLRVFESALRQFGVPAGMEAFDRLVEPFFQRLLRERREREAATVLLLTRRLLPVDPASQFAAELAELERELAAAERRPR